MNIIKVGATVEVRGMTGTVLEIQGERVLVEARQKNGGYRNIWVSPREIQEAIQ